MMNLRAARLRIVAISDTHTLHDRVRVPEGDVLVHGGDLTSNGDLDDVSRFDEFLGRLPHRHKVVIAGNHDFCFEQRPEAARRRLTHCIYLQDEAVEIEGVKFWGSPWQPWFYDWAFNLKRGAALQEKWAMIPSDIDVLVTHGPPLGEGDQTFRGERVGCQDLREAVLRVRPKVHIFGHIHEGAGVTRGEHTVFANACTCDLDYEPKNPPIVLDLHADGRVEVVAPAGPGRAPA